MSDRVAVMREGVIVQEAAPREIYSRPVDLYVAGFLGRINRFAAVVEAVNGDDIALRVGTAQLTVSRPATGRAGQAGCARCAAGKHARARRRGREPQQPARRRGGRRVHGRGGRLSPDRRWRGRDRQGEARASTFRSAHAFTSNSIPRMACSTTTIRARRLRNSPATATVSAESPREAGRLFEIAAAARQDTSLASEAAIAQRS